MKDSLGRRNNRSLRDRKCPHCGKTFRPRKRDSKYCSRPCAWPYRGGHNRKPECWWVNARGYVEGRVWIGDTPRRVKQHRWIMEKYLGRPLAADEDVHHLNGVKSDNRIENLVVMSHGKHSTLTGIGRIQPKGYKLNLTKEERERRADAMRRFHERRRKTS